MYFTLTVKDDSLDGSNPSVGYKGFVEPGRLLRLSLAKDDNDGGVGMEMELLSGLDDGKIWTYGA